MLKSAVNKKGAKTFSANPKTFLVYIKYKKMLSTFHVFF